VTRVSQPLTPALSGAAAAVTAVGALLLAGCTEEPDIQVATSEPPAATATTSASSSPAGASTETPAEPSTTTLTASPTEEGATVFVTIGPDSVTPVAETVDLSVGAPLTLDITASRAAELHVHSSPEREIEVDPGHSTVELSFDKPGTVDVEEHESDSLILRVLVR